MVVVQTRFQAGDPSPAGPDELLSSTSADPPVVAVRVRATVGQPGGSAQAAWRRARAAEWAAWTRTLPWRLAITLGTAAGGWGSPEQPARAPAQLGSRRGAVGERRTALLLSSLERHGWVVLHDPGVAVVPIVAVHGAQVPWGKMVMNGVPVVPARRLPACFVASRRCWVPSGSPGWPTRPGSASTPLPNPETRVQGPRSWLPVAFVRTSRSSWF